MSVLKILAVIGWIAAASMLMGVAQAQSTLDKARNDEVSLVLHDDPAMERAFKKAKHTLDGFLDLAADPPPGSEFYAVKVGIRQGNETEYFWISPFTANGRSFTGQVNNTPRIVTRVREGETIEFERDEIVDWTYYSNNKMRGNFTACALLTHESLEDAAQFMAEYGLECDQQ
jgi:uncharacterized protein YegJ (DUF2314 family)